MRITANDPLVKAIASRLNVQPEQVKGLALFVGLGDQTALLHTFCCHSHMAKEITEMVNEPYLDITVTEN